MDYKTNSNIAGEGLYLLTLNMVRGLLCLINNIKTYIIIVTYIMSLMLMNTESAFEYSGKTAREEGQADIFVAISDNSSTVFNNVAGLSFLSRPELMTSYGRLYIGMDDNRDLSNGLISIGYNLRKGKKYLGGIGLGWTRLNLAELYHEDTIELGYSYKVSTQVAIGIGVKSLRVTYMEDKYTQLNTVFNNGKDKGAIGLDLGILYKGEKIDIGCSALNINSPDVGIKYENKVLPILKGGLNIKSEGGNLGLELNYHEKDIDVSVGGEKWLFDEAIGIRGGLKLGAREDRKFSVGISYSDGWYQLDYGFIYPFTGVTETIGTHKIDLILYIGKKPIKKKEEKKKEEKKEEPRKDEKQEPEEVVMKKKIVEMTDLEQKSLVELIREVKRLVESGELKLAKGKLIDAVNLSPDNAEANEMFSSLDPIDTIYPELIVTDKKTGLLKKVILAYMNKRGKEAVNTVRYATQLWPEDINILQLRAVIERRFSDITSQEKLVPGLNIIEQKLQQVLENIYDKKWVAAIAIADEVLDLDPENILAIKRQGSAYFGMGDVVKAKEIWRRALKLKPDDRELRDYLETEGEKKIEKKVDREIEEGFNTAVNYYRKLVEQGADKKIKRNILEKIIEKYRKKGIDMSNLEKELKELKGE